MSRRKSREEKKKKKPSNKLFQIFQLLPSTELVDGCERDSCATYMTNNFRFVDKIYNFLYLLFTWLAYHHRSSEICCKEFLNVFEPDN